MLRHKFFAMVENCYAPILSVNRSKYEHFKISSDGSSSVIVINSPAYADGFRPDDNCFRALATSSDSDKAMIAAWAYGFLAAKQGEPAPVDAQNNATMLGNMIDACARKPNVTLFELLDASRKPTADISGSEAHARKMLMQFFKPNADLIALTASLKPSAREIRAVYREPLASDLITGYNELFTPGIKFGPKPEHDKLLTSHATTAGLRAGDAVLREFPDGYKKHTQLSLCRLPDCAVQIR